MVTKNWRVGGLLLLGALLACDSGDGGTTFTPSSQSGSGDDDDDDQDSGDDDDDDTAVDEGSNTSGNGDDDDDDDDSSDPSADSTSTTGAEDNGDVDPATSTSSQVTTDDPATTSTTGEAAAVTTEFETLMPMGTGGPMDPTNTSADTNATGAETEPRDTLDIIDDFEDGDPVIYEKDGRIGVWYIYVDEDATPGTTSPPWTSDFVPTPGGPNDSLFSGHVVASGWPSWGPGLGFDISNSGGAVKGSYDASGYTGIAFQMRASYEGLPADQTRTVSVSFGVEVAASISVENGGTCTSSDCWMNKGTFRIDNVSETWEQYLVPFSEMAAVGTGSAIFGLQWQLEGSSNEYDLVLALDDVGFY